jgi:hypothetical protein
MIKRWTHLASPRRAVLTAALLGSCLCALAGATAGASAATLPTLGISVTKTSVAVTGPTVSGGVNVAVTAAKGLKEPTVILVKLNPGVTLAEFEAFVATKKFSDPNKVGQVGAIVLDLEGRPGGVVEAQTELQPGIYSALNLEGENPKNPPHAGFTVTASPAPAALPKAQAVEKTIDFGFRGPTTLKVGELVRFENEGFLVHMNVVFPVKSKKSANLAVRLLKAGKERAVFKLVSAQPFGFYGPLSPGAFQQETITAKPGWYVQACFMGTQDGRIHTLLGMERAFHVVK